MSIVDFSLLQQRRHSRKRRVSMEPHTLPLCHPIQSRLLFSCRGAEFVNSGELHCVCVSVTSLLRGSFQVNVLKLSVAGYLRRFVCSATWWCSLHQVLCYYVRVLHLGCQWGKNMNYRFSTMGLLEFVHCNVSKKSKRRKQEARLSSGPRPESEMLPYCSVISGCPNGWGSTERRS